ncbi:UbiA family prenyltransferase [Candidatus Riflebacteria bacterium]
MENQVKAYSLFSLSFWKAYGITCRPYLFFLSGVSGLVGLSMGKNLELKIFIPALIAFFFSYGLGQALTDVFQTDTDAISSPYRPLTQGLITGKQVLGVSLAGLGLCALVLFLCNPWTIPFTILGVIGLATYTPFKRRWWGGPFWNSWIVALLPVIGYLCLQPEPGIVFYNKALYCVMVSVFFSYAIFVLLGYFKDISADAQTGYNTLPVVFGWKVSVIVSTIFAIIATLASLLMLLYIGFYGDGGSVGLARYVAILLIGSGIFLEFYSHYGMWKISDEKDSHGPIANCIRAFALLHLGEAVALKPELAIFSILYYIAFEVVLAIRPERSQI